MDALLNAAAILAAADMAFEDVPIPEWGGSVRVRVMRATDRDSLSAAIKKAAGDQEALNYQCRLLVRCLVDDAGNPLFTEDDMSQLATRSAPVIDRLFEVADRLNGVGPKAVDNAEKN